MSVLVAGLLADAGAGEGAPPKPSPLDPGRYDQTFTLLPFGQTRAEVLKVLRQRFELALQPALAATTEARHREALIGQMERDLEAIRESWTEFKGQDTGYSLSVISTEFQHNADEGVLKYMYGSTSAYFLFSADRLFELFLCVEPNTDYRDMVEKFKGIYGAPTSIHLETEDPKGPYHAHWNDALFEINLAAHLSHYSCNRVRWTYQPMLPGIEQRRAAAKPSSGE
ncbi:MAG: hypothetical protein FJ098_07990 [Deltaproteobacteria bacterium]|nr:hypothetical protein [Deltaproteobacteria bacterium]